MPPIMVRSITMDIKEIVDRIRIGDRGEEDNWKGPKPYSVETKVDPEEEHPPVLPVIDPT